MWPHQLHCFPYWQTDRVSKHTVLIIQYQFHYIPYKILEAKIIFTEEKKKRYQKNGNFVALRTEEDNERNFYLTIPVEIYVADIQSGAKKS